MGRMSARDLTGPLSETQHKLLQMMVDGRKRESIGRELDRSVSWVSEHMASIIVKMSCRTSQQAIARYSRHLTLLGEAETMRKAMVGDPVDVAERHVNAVLEDMASEYVRRAYRMLPQ